MQMATSRVLGGAALVVAAALPARAWAARPRAAQFQPVDRFERTVPLAAGGTFSLANVNGSVLVEGWDREEAQISALKSSTAGEEELGQVGIAIRQAPGSVSVETRYLEGGSAEVSVEYRVLVPAHVRLALVSTVNGSVTVRNVTGSGTLVAINGNVMLARGAGLFSARATNGNISLEVMSFEGGLAPSGTNPPASALAGISAQTVNGTVVVALPPEAGAELDARTQNGDFSSDVPLLAETSAAGRAIRGRIGAGGPALLLRAVNGSIRLRIARPLV
jgi:hypothetical protein